MIHVLVPFTRDWLIKEWTERFRPFGVILYPICSEPLNWPKEDWIKPLIHAEFKSDPCYDKLNWFKETQEIIDDDYYFCMGDDDSIEPNVFEEISKMNDEVVVVTLKRGDDVPFIGSICGTAPLIAAPEYMKLWMMGLAQIFMKGRHFKKLKFRENTFIGDGYMAEDTKKYCDDNGIKIAFRPDLNVRHNYYQPGRWARLGDDQFYKE